MSKVSARQLLELIQKIRSGSITAKMLDQFLSSSAQTYKSEQARPAPLSLDRRVSLKELARESTAEFERDLIMRALSLAKGSVTRAAQLLMISYKTLKDKMDEYSIPEGYGVTDL